MGKPPSDDGKVTPKPELLFKRWAGPRAVKHHVKIVKPPLPARFDYFLCDQKDAESLWTKSIRESHTCSNLTNVKTGAPMWDLSKNVGLQ